jgi:hypothetical protein
MQPRERELRLGLDPANGDDVHVHRPLARILEQRGLPDAGFPAHHQRATARRPGAVEQGADLGALHVTPVEHVRIVTRGPPS